MFQKVKGKRVAAWLPTYRDCRGSWDKMAVPILKDAGNMPAGRDRKFIETFQICLWRPYFLCLQGVFLCFADGG